MLRDVPVLAEHTAQVALPEEYRARAVRTTQAVFFAKVWEGARDDRVPARVAYPRDVLQAVDVAVTGTGAAVLEFTEGVRDALLEFAATVECEIGGFEVLDHEAPFVTGCAGTKAFYIAHYTVA